MENWDLFTDNDLLIAIVGATGLVSAFIVMKTAIGNVVKREYDIRPQRPGNLTPEENVMED